MVQNNKEIKHIYMFSGVFLRGHSVAFFRCRINSLVNVFLYIDDQPKFTQD